MRNLILMHLESLNYVNYQVNKRLFPCLSLYESKSLTFSNYYSTATSTLMVIGDMLYGDMLQYEVCNNLDCIPSKYRYTKSFFDQLNNQGYETKSLYFPVDSNDCISAQRRRIVGFNNELKLIKSYETYMLEIEEVINKEKPFALLLCNTISNVSLNQYLPYGRFDSGLDRWRYGYEFIDKYVSDVMGMLNDKDLLDNTTIIFYGDHGDDYFAHGNHSGLTHAIEPYSSLIHVPFWIYDVRLIEKEICNMLLCTLDVKTIIEKLLKMPEKKIYWDELNIFPRKYVFSRNAYAAQPVRSNSFNKGYSITDGKFLILVSNKGLEMYDIEMDMLCQNNLLNFYIYKDGILHLNEKLNDTLLYHYRYIINMSSIRQIRQVFYFYRKRLYEETLKLFEYAECIEKISEIDFKRVHYT